MNNQNLVYGSMINDERISQILDKVDLKKRVLIFFTPGGWGHASIEKETYAKSLLEGIKKTLNDWKYQSLVIGYPRAKGGIWSRIKSLKEIIFSFTSESKKLSNLIENITARFKNIKIILIGYSFGGAFVNAVMKRVKNKNQVYGIEAGVPFFYKIFKSKNVLILDNGGRDALAKRNLGKLSFIGILGLLKLVFLFKLIRLQISEAFHNKEHEYFWGNPQIRSGVESFLKNNFSRNRRS